MNTLYAIFVCFNAANGTVDCSDPNPVTEEYCLAAPALNRDPKVWIVCATQQLAAWVPVPHPLPPPEWTPPKRRPAIQYEVGLDPVKPH